MSLHVDPSSRPEGKRTVADRPAGVVQRTIIPGRSSPGEWRALSLEGSERLARSMEVGERDDSLAIEYSILRDEQQVYTLEHQVHPYDKWWAWGPADALALSLAVRTWVWRGTVYPFVRNNIPEKQRGEKWLLGPERGSWFFDKSHPLSRAVRDGVTTSAALDAVYAAPLVLPESPDTYSDRLARFWFFQPEAQAVRNRLRLTYLRMLAELENRWGQGQRNFRVLSLACGSAQASIEVVSEFLRRHPDAHVELMLVDLNSPSLARAARLAQARDVADRVLVVEKNLREFLTHAPERYWDIVEMVGFLDYRTEKSVVWLAGQIRPVLVPGGLCVVAHIAPSPHWGLVTRWVHNWPLMIRRTPEHFRSLMVTGGFHQDATELLLEPWKIHPICLCRRVDA